MDTLSCTDHRFRHTAGPYLLGTLDRDERAAYEEHLAHCPDCRAGVDCLTPVVEMLGAVPRDDAPSLDQDDPYADPPAPPDTLLPGLLERARRRTRRRRIAVGSLAAVAAAALIAVAALATGDTRPPEPARAVASQVVLTPRDDTPMRATAEVKSVPWGTQITLHCHYDNTDGYPADRDVVYTLQVDGATGAHDLGSWAVTTGASAVFTSGTALKHGQIDHIEVLGPDGSIVLSSDG